MILLLYLYYKVQMRSVIIMSHGLFLFFLKRLQWQISAIKCRLLSVILDLKHCCLQALTVCANGIAVRHFFLLVSMVLVSLFSPRSIAPRHSLFAGNRSLVSIPQTQITPHHPPPLHQVNHSTLRRYNPIICSVPYPRTYVTIYRKLQIGRGGHLNQSKAHDIL